MNEIKLQGEIPQIELRATGEDPIISNTEQDYQAYRALLAIQEKEKRTSSKHQKTNTIVAILTLIATIITIIITLNQ